MFSLDTQLYQRSPVWFQEAFIAAWSLVRQILRERSRFHDLFAQIQQTQWLSAAQLEELHLNEMVAIVRHAAESVPYYSDLFRNEGIRPQDLRSLDDFRKIPFLSKRQVVEAGASMLATNHRGLRFKSGTGGTTGLSMTGYRDLPSINRENAFLWRQLQWAGFQKGQRRAWIRGEMIVPVSQTAPPFWRFNRPDNMLMMSSIHLSYANADAYIKALQEFDPALIQAYPSSIAYLAKYLDSRGKCYAAPSLKAIVTSSETLLGDHRRTIERVMACPVFDCYGTFERVAAIGTCEHLRYHILSDYSFVELVPQTDGTAELVGTGFHNFLMPFLRYRAGDAIALAEPNSTCPCGRSFPVIKQILGRLDDCVKTPDGRHIGMMINIFDGLETLWEGQIVQDRLHEIRILVVPIGQFEADDRTTLISRARARLGSAMSITVDAVPSIPRTKSGKLRAVVCNV